ncbi:MAG: lipoate protein ligase C-terminal domain-containing protein [Nitrososphaera sp.]
MKIAHNLYKSQKLIRINLEYSERENTINQIRISGDFFFYPEEALEALEADLIGRKMERDTLKQEIEKSLGKTEVYGFDSTSLTEAILGCKT